MACGPAEASAGTACRGGRPGGRVRAWRGIGRRAGRNVISDVRPNGVARRQPGTRRSCDQPPRPESHQLTTRSCYSTGPGRWLRRLFAVAGRRHPSSTRSISSRMRSRACSRGTPAISNSSYAVSSCRTEATTARVTASGSSARPAALRPTRPLPRVPVCRLIAAVRGGGQPGNSPRHALEIDLVLEVRPVLCHAYVPPLVPWFRARPAVAPGGTMPDPGIGVRRGAAPQLDKR